MVILQIRGYFNLVLNKNALKVRTLERITHLSKKRKSKDVGNVKLPEACHRRDLA